MKKILENIDVGQFASYNKKKQQQDIDRQRGCLNMCQPTLISAPVTPIIGFTRAASFEVWITMAV